MERDTAVIETLVAEVRVLMIGSRQVTRSVFRQLDIVEYFHCEAMGRINDAPDMLWIIGRDESGQLVRAQLTFGPWHDVQRRPAWTVELQQQLEMLSAQGYQQARQRKQELLRYRENLDFYGVAWDLYFALPLIILAGLR